MKNPGFTCDRCMRLGSGEELSEWWLISEQDDNGVPRFSMSPYVAEFSSAKGMKHACSKKCADVLTHHFLRNAKVDKKAFEKFLREQYRNPFASLFSIGESDD
jgi:hypothetical protein